MKIAFVCPYYDPAIDGPKQVIKELASRLIREGHDVHVYTSDWDKAKRVKIKEETIDGVKVHRCYHILRVSQFSTVFPSVFFKLIKEDFDVIHTHVTGWAHVFFASLAAKIKKIRLIHTTHCPWTDAYRTFAGNFWKIISYNIFMRLSYRWSDKIIAITPWEIHFIEKYGGKGKIEVIPNGVDDIFFKRVKNNSFKKNNKINGNIVLFFGRLNVTKGPDKFVLAAKEILKERKDITFVIIGNDEGMKQEVKKLIGNEKNIYLLDPIKERAKVAEMYQASEVYVLPSFREGLPLTIFEAMASGIPIVASPVNGIPYEMKQPENGFFCDYGDINCLKKQILNVIDNKKLALKIGNNNIKKAKNYKWDDIYTKTISLYKG
ncbi:MAG: glycosyltransferase family 4 protein [Nanoarchaeota archaeon]